MQTGDVSGSLLGRFSSPPSSFNTSTKQTNALIANHAEIYK